MEKYSENESLKGNVILNGKSEILNKYDSFKSSNNLKNDSFTFSSFDNNPSNLNGNLNISIGNNCKRKEFESSFILNDDFRESKILKNLKCKKTLSLDDLVEIRLELGKPDIPDEIAIGLLKYMKDNFKQIELKNFEESRIKQSLMMYSKSHKTELRLLASDLFNKVNVMVKANDKLKSQSSLHPSRKNIINLYIEMFKSYENEITFVNSSELKLNHIISKANEFELEIYDLFKNDILKNKTDNYIAKAKMIYGKIIKNSELRINILNNNTSLFEVVRMSEEELTSKDIIEKIQKKIQDDFDSRRNDWVKVQSKGKEGLYTCFKCKSKNTVYHQMQTRRADEGMTTFVDCVNCGNKWKC